MRRREMLAICASQKQKPVVDLPEGYIFNLEALDNKGNIDTWTDSLGRVLQRRTSEPTDTATFDPETNAVTPPRFYTDTVANLPIKGTGDFTISIAYKISYIDTSRTLAGGTAPVLISAYGAKESYNSGRYYIRYYNKHMEFDSATPSWVYHTPSDTLDEGDVIVTVTRINNLLKIYYNDKCVYSETCDHNLCANDMKLEIGCYGMSYTSGEYNSNYATGTFYGAAMYDKGLSPEEVSQVVDHYQTRYSLELS